VLATVLRAVVQELTCPFSCGRCGR
jgi:hypothetical protein